jgi:YD repeat-containing protein
MLFAVLTSLIIGCANQQTTADTLMAKTSYKINEATGDSCLVEKDIYFTDDTHVTERYDYYDCTQELVYRAFYERGLLKGQVYYNLETKEPKIKYSYTYNEQGDITSIITYDKSIQQEVKTTVTNSYNEQRELVRQIYKDIDDQPIREVIYTRLKAGLVEKTDKDLISQIEVKTVYENGKKIKEKKNRIVNKWQYNAAGQLIEFVKNPYERDVYLYDESGNLVQINNIRKRGDEEVVLEKELIYYYPNDSIKARIIKDNGRREELIRYYYSRKSKSNQ